MFNCFVSGISYIKVIRMMVGDSVVRFSFSCFISGISSYDLRLLMNVVMNSSMIWLL